MNKPDELSSPSTSTEPMVEGVWRRWLRLHPDAERMQGVLEATSPAVQREIERLRTGESGRLPIVAKVPEESRYIILTEAAALAAGKALGLVAPQVHIVNCTSMAHALALMIELNQAQPKSPLDVAMEVYYCHCAQKDLAKERQRRGGGDHRSAAAKASKADGTVPSEPAGTVRGETRDIVAKITHQTRADVALMIGLVAKALEENPKVPRDTKIGRALARPDADLKAIVRESGVLKAPSTTRNLPASGSEPSSSTTTKGTTSSKTSSGMQTSSETTSTSRPKQVTTRKLESLIDHLVALEDAAEMFAASSHATATKRSPHIELAQTIAYELSDVARRLHVPVSNASLDIPSKTHMRGPAACRDFLMGRMVKSSKSLRDAITAALGQDGTRVLKALLADTRDIDPKQLLAVLRVLVTQSSSKQ